MKAQWILRRLPQAPAPIVLDYGTGEGKYLQLIRKERPQARMIGVDIRAAQPPENFVFHPFGPNNSPPFAAAGFDVVVSCDVLEDVDSIERSPDEVHRVTRPGAVFASRAAYWESALLEDFPFGNSSFHFHVEKR